MLLQLLQKLQEAISLHICISIRLDPAKNQIISLDGLVASNTIFMPDENPDIDAYIDGELENLLFSEKLKLGNPAIILDIQKKLMDGSQGMFLWVALQLQTLCMMKTDEEIRQSLENLPKDLPETFARILQRSGERNRSSQRQILELVAVAYRALSTEELREALSVVPGDTTWRPSHQINDIISTLACCGGLVVVESTRMMNDFQQHSHTRTLLIPFSPISVMGCLKHSCQPLSLLAWKWEMRRRKLFNKQLAQALDNLWH
jgi:hypothetical protein